MISHVSIDPGVNACGVAAWYNGSLLNYAELIPKHSTRSMAKTVQDRLIQRYGRDILLARLVIEKPQVYAGAKNKGDPNDLIDLALVVGGLMEMFAAADVYRPAEWKGQAPKRVTTERARRVLKPAERLAMILPSAKSAEHNVWDAVALGLRHLGRRVVGGDEA